MSPNTFRFLILLLLVNTAQGAGLQFSGVTKTVAIPAVCSGSPVSAMPKWEAGRLFCFDRWAPSNATAPNFSVIDGNTGQELVKSRLVAPGVWKFNVKDVSVSGVSGYVAAGVAYSDTGVRSGVLIRLDESGNITQLIQLEPYEPERVAVGPDGSVWTLGSFAPADGIHFEPYNLLHRYSPDGKLIKEVLPRSSFATKTEPALVSAEGAPALVMGRNRIGVFLPQSSEWIEVNFEGEVVLRKATGAPDLVLPAGYKGGGSLTKMAASGVSMTPSGEVYASFQGGTAVRVWHLDRTHWVWEPIQASSRDVPQIVGSDGESLITHQGWKALVWRQPIAAN